MEIVAIKGIFSGSGGIILGLIVGERLDNLALLILALILGFFSYGMSIYFYSLFLDIQRNACPHFLFSTFIYGGRLFDNYHRFT